MKSPNKDSFLAKPVSGKQDKKTKDGLPWSRRVGEPESAWAAFRHYRDQAYQSGEVASWSPRYPETTAAFFGLPPSTVEEWSAQWGWGRRILAYDRHLDAVLHQTSLEAGAQIHRGQVRRLAKLTSHVEAELDRHLERSRQLDAATGGGTPTTTMKDILSALDFLWKIEQLRAERPTELTAHVETRIEWNLEGVDLDDLRAVEAIRAKMIKGSD